MIHMITLKMVEMAMYRNGVDCYANLDNEKATNFAKYSATRVKLTFGKFYARLFEKGLAENRRRGGICFKGTKALIEASGLMRADKETSVSFGFRVLEELLISNKEKEELISEAKAKQIKLNADREIALSAEAKRMNVINFLKGLNNLDEVIGIVNEAYDGRIISVNSIPPKIKRK